jgi:hypothetical protein
VVAVAAAARCSKSGQTCTGGRTFGQTQPAVVLGRPAALTADDGPPYVNVVVIGSITVRKTVSGAHTAEISDVIIVMAVAVPVFPASVILILTRLLSSRNNRRRRLPVRDNDRWWLRGFLHDDPLLGGTLADDDRGRVWSWLPILGLLAVALYFAKGRLVAALLNAALHGDFSTVITSFNTRLNADVDVVAVPRRV